MVHAGFAAGLSASANSRTDTAYYSPARDLAATAALAVDHTLYQRYDTVWSQQLLAGGGSYWQKNHAAGAITVLGYGQRLALEQRRRHRADAELG
ncbi:biofilm formation protein HmsH [Klebsiella pneumoniae]|nr:biofilm formation protein HmsH [Klebsiella pneumoniae]